MAVAVICDSVPPRLSVGFMNHAALGENWGAPHSSHRTMPGRASVKQTVIKLTNKRRSLNKRFLKMIIF